MLTVEILSEISYTSRRNGDCHYMHLSGIAEMLTRVHPACRNSRDHPRDGTACF